MDVRFLIKSQEIFYASICRIEAYANLIIFRASFIRLDLSTRILKLDSEARRTSFRDESSDHVSFVSRVRNYELEIRRDVVVSIFSPICRIEFESRVAPT